MTAIWRHTSKTGKLYKLFQNVYLIILNNCYHDKHCIVGFHIKSTKILKFRILYAKGIRYYNCCSILLEFVSEHLNMQPNILNFWIFGDLKIKGIGIVCVSEVKSTIFLNWVQNFGLLWGMTRPLNWAVAMQICLQ